MTYGQYLKVQILNPLLLILSITIIILSIGVNLKRDKTILYSRSFLLALLNTTYIASSSAYSIFLNKGVTLLGGLYFMSYVNIMFSIYFFIFCLMVGIITSFFPRKILLEENSVKIKLLNNFIISKYKIINAMNEQYKILEYTLIILFIIIGGIFLMTSNDLISLFLSIELQSYGLYIISSIYRNSESSTSAGLTYFLLGSLSSCFILLSASLLYANSGCTSLDSLYIISNISDTYKDISQNNIIYSIYLYNPYYIHFSLTILSIGLLFKISAAPFHFWSPDVYDAVPTVVTTFISVVAKITILIFLLELIDHTYSSLYVSNFGWTSSLIISSLLSLVIGAVLGLTQTRIKRLLAYSSISHIGFILLVLSIKSVASTQAFLFYLIQYTISNLNAFIILIVIGYSLYYYVYKGDKLNKYEIYLKERNNSPIQVINQLKGYFYINPFLSLSLSITFFSFIGIPPLIGFFAKYMALFASINNGYVFMSIIAIITSVISGVYYLIVIKQIFFEKTDYTLNPALKNISLSGILEKKDKQNKEMEIKFNINNVVLSSSLTILISILTLLILLFIFIFSELFNLMTILSISYIY